MNENVLDVTGLYIYWDLDHLCIYIIIYSRLMRSDIQVLMQDYKKVNLIHMNTHKVCISLFIAPVAEHLVVTADFFSFEECF